MPASNRHSGYLLRISGSLNPNIVMKDISFHITDVTENCIRAGASEMRLGLKLEGQKLELTIEDNGCGMSEETILKATNPFYTTRTTRKVGLGLPFLIQNAEQSGGGVEIKSEMGLGTVVKATFMLGNIDCPPVGDLAETFMLIITGNPDINTVLTLSNGEEKFEISTEEIKGIMGGIPIGLPEVSTLVRDIIGSNIEEIFGDRIIV